MNYYDAFDKPDRPQPVGGPVINLNGARGLKYASAALRSECEELARMPPDSGRNMRLNEAAFKMARLVATGAIDAQTVRESLEAAARASGLPEHETQTVLRDAPGGALQVGQEHPRVIVELPAIPLTTVIDAADPDELAAKVREFFPRIDWHALWADDDEEEWIIEPLLPARRLVALYSPPKVGKSLLMLEMAVAISLGKPTMGVTPDRPRRVLYVDHENDPKGDIRDRLQSMGYGPDDLADLPYLSFPNMSALDSPSGGEELMAAVEAYAAEVVVIDTVSRAIKGDENENDTWLAFYRNTGKRLKAAGITMVRLDHTGKDETRGQRGGSAKGGDVDAVWRMSKVADETYRLDCEMHRMRVVEKTLVIHRQSTPLRHDVDALGRAAAWEVKVKAVMNLLDDAGAPQDTGSTKAREMVRAAGQKARNDVIAEALRRRKLSVPDWRGPVPNEDRSHDLGDRSGTDAK